MISGDEEKVAAFFSFVQPNIFENVLDYDVTHSHFCAIILPQFTGLTSFFLFSHQLTHSKYITLWNHLNSVVLRNCSHFESVNEHRIRFVSYSSPLGYSLYWTTHRTSGVSVCIVTFLNISTIFKDTYERQRWMERIISS